MINGDIGAFGDLWPTWTPERCSPGLQAEDLRELRRLSEEGLSGRHALGEQLLASAYPQYSLSLDDMARVARLSVVEVKNIIAEHLSAHYRTQQQELMDRVRQHSSRDC
jgi:hypothetical protein